MEHNSTISGVSILIPIYNEQDSIVSTLNAVHETLRKTNTEYEVILVNDGSRDNSKLILDSLQQPRTSIIHHPHNRGYGATLKTGIRSAKYDHILITDADGTYPIDRIPDLIAHAHEHDMVVGSRTGANVHDTLLRSIGRGIVRRFASYVSASDIKDINSGFRIFKKETAEKFWHLFPEGFSFTSTITVASHTRGHSVHYMPIDYYKRAGKSSIKPFADFVGFMSLISRLAIYYKPLKVFVPLAIGLSAISWIALAVAWFGFHLLLHNVWLLLNVVAIQSLMFGFLAEMIVKRFYSE